MPSVWWLFTVPVCQTRAWISYHVFVKAFPPCLEHKHTENHFKGALPIALVLQAMPVVKHNCNARNLFTLSSVDHIISDFRQRCMKNEMLKPVIVSSSSKQ